MKETSWWDLVFGDVGWVERQRLNEASSELGDLRNSSQLRSSQIEKLFELDKAQGREIERLRLTVRVLTELLVDTMGLDEKILHYRMEAAVDEAQRAHEEKSARGKVVRCSTCSQKAPFAEMEFIGFGLVCEACRNRKTAPPSEGPFR